MTGSIPACLFTDLPNLKTLYLTGNGLVGSLPTGIITESLVNLSLSYNHLSGLMPNSCDQADSVVIHLNIYICTFLLLSIAVIVTLFTPSFRAPSCLKGRFRLACSSRGT